MKFKLGFILLYLIIACSYILKGNQQDEEYYIYSDKWEHGIPTGFMGERDGKGMKLNDGWKENPYGGEKCIKITADNSESWRGIYIQYTGSWNVALDEKTPLPDLSDYDKLQFYARAEDGKEGFYVIPEIGVGGGGHGEDKKSETFLEIGPQWRKYTISLNGMDLKRINSLMFFTLPVGTLYLDEIKFVKSKSKKKK